MRASYLYEKEEMCPKACCGMPVSECTCGPDCEHCDCYEKNQAKNEGIEGMMPNTQVRGIMPKQRKPYHKHKIKSNHEPETDLSEEHDEYDPRKVKADVVKHLVNMYNDAKKDGGYSSEKMHVALKKLLHDMDMAGYMNSDYFDIEGFFHKGIAKKQDYKVSMDMLRRAINQAKGLDTDTSVDPAIFTRGGSAMKSVATEDNEKADPAIVKRFAGVSDSQRSYYVMKWAEEQGIPTDKAMELAGYEKGEYMGAGAYHWRYVGDEDMYESEEKNYVCVHAKKGKYSCKATSSYGAAKKAAEHWGLKSTAGIDAHLADEKKTATESMLRSVVKELTEAEFDEAAGEKDACYHKVKSRYKVWPSAYASGALVKCRKVGAANWGKSKK